MEALLGTSIGLIVVGVTFWLTFSLLDGPGLFWFLKRKPRQLKCQCGKHLPGTANYCSRCGKRQKPSTAVATESWADRIYSVGKSGITAGRVFQVVGVADEKEAIAEAGICEGSIHPLDCRLRIPKDGVTAEEQGGKWIVRASYE